MTHILIINAPFYEDISAELNRGAIAALEAKHVTYELIEVPGAFEIPAVIRMAMDTGKYDGYVALGCVLRGETSHYDYVCGESARGLQELAIQHKLPIGYGILTCEDDEQAWERAAVEKGNKGAFAADTCLRMLEIKRRFEGK